MKEGIVKKIVRRLSGLVARRQSDGLREARSETARLRAATERLRAIKANVKEAT